MALYFLGDDLRMQGAIAAARASYLESLQLYRRMGNQIYLAYPLGNLGRLALLEGDTAAARRSFAECVMYSRRNGNGISLVDWLIRLGTVAVYEGDSSAARAAFEEAATLSRKRAAWAGSGDGQRNRAGSSSTRLWARSAASGDGRGSPHRV